MSDYDNRGLYIGAHMSIAGGVENALLDAVKVGATAVQIFVKNNTRWKGAPLNQSNIRKFKEIRARIGIHKRHVIAHSGYLINLAGTKPDVTAKSLVALEDELTRCAKLEVHGLVMHPGSHLQTSVEEGIDRLAKAVRAILTRQSHNPTKILFETMVGAGSQIGGKFEHLKWILDAVDKPDQTGVCMDTCHIFSAGYELRTFEKYNQTMKEFDKVVGLDKLGALHLNDSVHGFSEKKDRHQHVGDGAIGNMAFQYIVNDERLAHLPMIIETPKGENHEYDIKNLDHLRSLIR